MCILLQVVTVAQQPTTNIIALPARPSTYLALSLLNLICCCLPIGIAALIYSLRVQILFIIVDCWNEGQIYPLNCLARKPLKLCNFLDHVMLVQIITIPIITCTHNLLQPLYLVQSHRLKSLTSVM